jgi:malate/lactate dehydrogenase
MTKETKKPQQKPSLEAFQEEIRKRAEEIFKERITTNAPGHALTDWLQAEKEIQKKYKV